MRTLRLVVLWMIAVVCLAGARAYAEDWQPVTPSDLSAKPEVDPAADAEALFWNILVEQSMSKTVLHHYIRVKIFTVRGAESQSRVDLSFAGKEEIKDIAGRTIKADGSPIDLKNDSIILRTIAKAKKVNVQVKTIVFPAVTPGCLIEYRWTEVRPEDDPFHFPLEVQRDIPVRRVEYDIRPLSTPIVPNVQPFNIHADSVTYPAAATPVSVAVASIPAFREEPAMPPKNAIVPWLLLYYLDRNCETCTAALWSDKLHSVDAGRSTSSLLLNLQASAAPQMYWERLGRFVYDKLKGSLKVTNDIQRAASTIIGNTDSPEQKLAKLYDFCTSSIKRIDNDDPETRDQVKPNKSPAETLARKLGTARDIDFLLIALANAAGLEARYAMLGDYERPTIDVRYPAPFLLNSYSVAVRLNGQWKFFDPGLKYQPFGMLRWREEGVSALLIDEKEPVFVKTPISKAQTSLLKRDAALQLSEDGTLEGDIRMYFFGHFGADEKESMDDLTPTEREQVIRNGIKKRMSSAEVTDIQIENVNSPKEVITESYHVRVPSYAQRTGRRLLFQPGYFQQGVPSLFSSSTRTQEIFFHHAWTETDTISIEMPPGFTLEAPERPQEISAGTTGRHISQVETSPDGRNLKYSRSVSFGLDGTLRFPVTEYSNVRRVFDVFHERDSYSVSLVQSAQTSGKAE